MRPSAVMCVAPVNCCPRARTADSALVETCSRSAVRRNALYARSRRTGGPVCGRVSELWSTLITRDCGAVPTEGDVMTLEIIVRRAVRRGDGCGHPARGVAPILILSIVLAACGGSPSGASSSTSSGSSTVTSTPHVLSGVSVTGPVRVGTPTFDKTLYGTSFDLSKVGYESSQFFFSGIAHSYVPAQPLTSDGKWKIMSGVSAPYKTRIAVYRPINARKFNGTVV